MKKVALLMLCALPLFGQGYRFDSNTFTTPGTVPPPGTYPPALVVPGASVFVCTTAACNVAATTYTDATLATACPANAQITLPGSTLCVATTGKTGQFGFWLGPNSGSTYYYRVTLPSGAVYGTTYAVTTSNPSPCPYGAECINAFGGTVGAVGGTRDTLSAPLAAAIAALPQIVGGSGGQGKILLGNTDPAAVPNGTYLIGAEISTSTRTLLAGASGSPRATFISPTTGFAPVALGTYMLNVINAASSNPCNNNFYAGIENIWFNAFANGNQYLSGLDLCLSSNSYVNNVAVWFGGGVGFNVGGTVDTNADNVIFSNDASIGHPASTGPYPVLVKYPAQGSLQQIHSHVWTNLTATQESLSTGEPGFAAGAQVPSIDLGSVNDGITMLATKCEACQYPLAIGGSDADIDIVLSTECDNLGTNCPQTYWPYAVTISPSANNIHVKVIQAGHTETVVYADYRSPGLTFPMGYKIVDPYLHIEQITSSTCASSTAQSLSWPDSPASTTNDGACTWTDEGAAPMCAPGIANAPCIAATGATSSTDTTYYTAECTQYGCITGNQNLQSVIFNIQGTIAAAKLTMGTTSLTFSSANPNWIFQDPTLTNFTIKGASGQNGALFTTGPYSGAGTFNIYPGGDAYTATSYHFGGYLIPTTLYSAAGTAIGACNSGSKGWIAVVSDAAMPTYGATYTSGGAVLASVVCNGSNWVTQ